MEREFLDKLEKEIEATKDTRTMEMILDEKWKKAPDDSDEKMMLYKLRLILFIE